MPLPVAHRILLTGVESDRPQLEGATAHGTPGHATGSGHGDQHMVEGKPTKARGFFRNREQHAEVTSPEARLPELEGSSRPAQPE